MDVGVAKDRLTLLLMILVVKTVVHHLLFYFLKFVSQRVKNLLDQFREGDGDVYVGMAKDSLTLL